MQLTPVNSTRFKAIGFDEDEFHLFVQYHPTKADPDGTIWRYANVSPEQFDDMKRAESIGKYFGLHIQGNPDHPPLKVRQDGSEEAPEAAAEQEAIAEPAFRNPEDAIASAMVVANQAKQLQITTAAAYGQAGQELVRLASEIRRREAFFAPMKEAAYRTHKEICAREAEALRPLKEAERALSTGITRYREEEERRRRAEQDRIDAEQRRRAQEEADRRAQQLAEERAKMLEARGEEEKAAEVRMNPAPVAPAYVPPAVVQKEVPTVEGLSFAKDWDFEIVEPAQVPLSHDYYTLDEKKIRARVKQMKQHCQIPGVRVFPIERTRKRASA